MGSSPWTSSRSTCLLSRALPRSQASLQSSSMEFLGGGSSVSNFVCREGGDLKALVWPDKPVVRGRAFGRRIPCKTATKAAWQAVFDWREFAEKNGIEIPE
jgi:hypothetical protein